MDNSKNSLKEIEMNNTYLAQGMKFLTPHGTKYNRVCNLDLNGEEETRASFDDVLIAKTDEFLLGKDGYSNLDDALSNGVEWHKIDDETS